MNEDSFIHNGRNEREFNQLFDNLSDTHRENLKGFCKLKSWLLLIFSTCLHNQ